MKFIRNSFFTLFLLFFLSATAFSQSVVLDEIAAKVEGYVVFKSDVEAAHQNYLEQGGTDFPGLKCEILKQLVINKVMVAKAEIDSVLVDDAAVDEELERRKEYVLKDFGFDQEALEKSFGRSLRSIIEEMRPEVKEQMLARKMSEQITADIKVTPAQVRRFFQRIPKDSLYFLAEVEVGQLVKKPDVNKEEKDKVRNKLLAFRKRILEGGEDFAKIAKKESEDLGSAQYGGDLGWQGRGNFVPEFEAAVMKLAPNEISEPIESEFGFHLIQLLERRGSRFHCRHILIRPKPSTSDIARASKYLDSLRNLIIVDTISFEKAAKLYSDDKNSAMYGGILMNPETRQSFMEPSDLDPAIYSVVDKMKVGDVSKPLEFRQDNVTAVRLIYYKTYNGGHFAAYERDYQKLYQMALQQRKEQALDAWFLSAIKELYVEIFPIYGNDCSLNLF